MARDPYTLEIALDVSGKATGELYIDDGKSYDHQHGAYTLMKFKYSNQDGLEASVGSGGTKEFLGWKNKIERIVIMGNENTIEGNTVQVYQNGQVTGTAQFDKLGSGKLIIRKPNVELSTSWKIKIAE